MFNRLTSSAPVLSVPLAVGVLMLAVQISGSPVHVPSGTWQQVGTLSSVRSGTAAALLEDGRVLITGGETDTGPVAAVEIFDVNTGFFTPAAPMGAARSRHTAVTLHNGRVLVTGGRGLDGVTLDSAEIYDPFTDSWTAVGTMGHARARHTSSILENGYVLIAGGDNEGGATASLEIFNPFSGAFGEVGSLSSPRTAHAAALMPGNRVLVAGGSSSTGVLASSEILDFGNAAFYAGPNMAYAREELTATTLLDGRVLIAGGHDGTLDVAAAEVFDGAAFTLVGSLGEPRRGHLASLLPHNNQVLIVGGAAGNNPALSAELFRPWDGTFAPTGWPTDRREGASGSALNVDGLFLVQGGRWTSSAELYGFPTVKTDKDDYAPGETVTITGRGWQPGEKVTLVLREDADPPLHEALTLEAVADQNGNIVNASFAPEPHDVGIRFYLIAAGSESGLEAQATFTDAQEDYDHWADDASPSPAWINGALMANNSNYLEGEVVPHYFKSESLTVNGTYAFNIYYDYLDTGSPTRCGFDILTTYNISRTPGIVDETPTLDDATISAGNFYTANANITSVSGPGTLVTGNLVQRYVTVVFTALADKAEFYWGLRLALPGAVSGCQGAGNWPGASLQTDVRATPAVNGATMLGGGGTLQINPSGIIQGRISGFKWSDLDGDATVGGSEPKLSGWTIRLCSDANCTTVLQTTTTDANGNYAFNVIPGTYYVGEVVQSGWQQTFPTGSGIHGPLTVDATTPTHTDKNFGNRQQGSIEIIKDVDPEPDTTDFSFTTSANLSQLNNTFSLDDDTDNTLSNTKQFTNLAAGATYTITEDGETGYSLTNLQCTGLDGNDSASSNTGVVSVTLDAGQTVSCTYTNTKHASVRIEKVSIGGVGTFTFTNTIPTGPTSLTTVTAGVAVGATVNNVAPGTYTVTEVLPSGWNLTGLNCTGGGGNTSTSGLTATIGVDPGETITCTFTNTVIQEVCTDTKAPSVSVYATLKNPTRVQLRVIDTGSGVQTIEVIVAKNVTVYVPPFVPGTKTEIIVTATKINEGSSSAVGLRVTDACGNVTIFDPVTVTVNAGGRAEAVQFTDIPGDETLVEIQNVGLQQLRLTVNGRQLIVQGLGDGETRTIDIAWMMDAASANNTILLEPRGPKGASAVVTVYPPPALLEAAGTQRTRTGKKATIVLLPK